MAGGGGVCLPYMRVRRGQRRVAVGSSGVTVSVSLANRAGACWGTETRRLQTPVSTKRMTEAYRGFFTTTEHRLDRFFFYVIPRLFARFILNSRICSCRKKDLHDFFRSLGFAGCARCPSLCYRTVKRRRSVSSAGAVDVGTVLDKGFDCRRASKSYCMV